MNKGVVSMSIRIEVTKQLKQAYKTATRSEKSKILDQFCVTTGLSRVSARRYLTSPHLGVQNVTKTDRRHHRPTKYSVACKRDGHMWKCCAITRECTCSQLLTGSRLRCRLILPGWTAITGAGL